MVLEFAKIVFPFRTVAFFALYVSLNTVFYARSTIAHKFIVAGTQLSVTSTPMLPDRMAESLADMTTYPEFTSYSNNIFGWSIAGDIFIVFLFVVMMLGLLSTHAHISLLVAILHFIGVILITHMVCKNGSINFLICAVVFGIILPSVIEFWNILQIVAFKAYFYVAK